MSRTSDGGSTFAILVPLALDQKDSQDEHQEGAQVDTDQIGSRRSGGCSIRSDTTAQGARRNFARDVTSVSRPNQLAVGNIADNRSTTDMQADVPRTSFDAPETE